MMRYESVLSKIAPMFYKLVRYRQYFHENSILINEYLEHAKLPPAYEIFMPEKLAYFLRFFSEYIGPNIDKRIRDYTVMLETDRYYSSAYSARIDEFVIDMIINNFNFENESTIDPEVGYIKSFKTLFIALVGRELYEALRISVK